MSSQVSVMAVCDVCGNDMERMSSVCRFCGSRQENRLSSRLNGQLGGPKTFLHKTVNIEEGMPFVEFALNHLLAVIREAKSSKVQAITIIHGYGSTGKGGAIRTECRKTLDYLSTTGKVNCYIVGEEFNKRNCVVKNLLNRYPQLAKNKNLNRNNPGITLVVL